MQRKGKKSFPLQVRSMAKINWTKPARAAWIPSLREGWRVGGHKNSKTRKILPLFSFKGIRACRNKCIRSLALIKIHSGMRNPGIFDLESHSLHHFFSFLCNIYCNENGRTFETISKKKNQTSVFGVNENRKSSNQLSDF